MRSRVIRYSFLFLILWLMESIVCPITLRGIYPEYILVSVICLSMREYEKTGAIFGLIFGLLSDFTCSGVFGVKGVFFMAFGYVIGLLSRKYIDLNFMSACLVTVVCSSLFFFFTGLVGSFFVHETFYSVLSHIIIPKLVLTLPVILPVYPLSFLCSIQKRAGNERYRKD